MIVKQFLIVDPRFLNNGSQNRVPFKFRYFQSFLRIANNLTVVKLNVFYGVHNIFKKKRSHALALDNLSFMLIDNCLCVDLRLKFFFFSIVCCDLMVHKS